MKASKILVVLGLAVMFAAPAFAQTKSTPRSSEKQKYLKWNLEQAQIAATHALERYKEAMNSPAFDYWEWNRKVIGTHLLVKRAMANLCEAEEKAGSAHCKTTTTKTEHQELIIILYFNEDGSTEGTAYTFTETEHGDYEETEVEYTGSE